MAVVRMPKLPKPESTKGYAVGEAVKEVPARARTPHHGKYRAVYEHIKASAPGWVPVTFDTVKQARGFHCVVLAHRRYRFRARLSMNVVYVQYVEDRQP